MCIHLVLFYMESHIISNKQRTESAQRIVESDMRFDKDRSSLLRLQNGEEIYDWKLRSHIGC